MKKSEAMNVQAIKKFALAFTILENAQEEIKSRLVPEKWTIVHGDFGFLWVVTKRQANILMKHGYELVNQ